MALVSLPLELLFWIMGYLKPQDLLRLRLVCRHLSIVAGSITLKTVAFCLCKADLDVLQGIATRPDHAQHVTSLFCSAEMLFSKRFDFETYAQAIRRYKLTQDELRNHFDVYERLFEEQQDMLAQGTDSQVLEQLVSKLPNLSELQVASWPDICYSKRVASEWGKDWPFRTSWPFGPNKIENTPIVSDWGVEDGGGPSRHLRALLRGILKAGTKLRTIRATGMHYDLFDRDQFGLADVTHLLGNVTFFELSVNPLSEWDHDYGLYQMEDGEVTRRYTLRPHVAADGSICKTTMKQGVLRTALLNMPNLTTLKLGVGGAIFPWMLTNGICNPPCLEDMLAPEQSWPNLQLLDLVGMYCKQDQLVGLVLAVKTSLVTLELSSVRLLNGSWPKLLRQLKDGFAGRRVEVLLEGLADWPNDTARVSSKEWSIKGHDYPDSVIQNYFNDPAISDVPLEETPPWEEGDDD